MAGLPRATYDEWRSPTVLGRAVEHLREGLADNHPTAMPTLRTAPLVALHAIPGLTVEQTTAARTPVCPIDGTYDASTATIRYRHFGNARDDFTLLHELAHHLLAQDEDWCFEVRPALEENGGEIEERIASAFAAAILIEPADAEGAFRHGVTGSSLRDLVERSRASASAVLMRSLEEPGHRLVMITSLAGSVMFAQTTGEPYAPGRGTSQPGVLDLIERARLNSERRAGKDGGIGILYATGKTNPHVRLDVALDGGYAYVVATPLAVDLRINTGSDDPSEWYHTCVQGCGHTFARSEADSTCPECTEPRCPRCNGCECQREVYCSACIMSLPTARARTGATVCEDCE
jgi:hypothetical protein